MSSNKDAQFCSCMKIEEILKERILLCTSDLISPGLEICSQRVMGISWDLVKMQILRLHYRLTRGELWGVVTQYVF